MPNVSFKQGLQENLNKSTTQKVAGAFYLTTDTNRLYYCDGTSFKDLNQYINKVSAIANLPTAGSASLEEGDFYYAEAENILCRYKKTNASSGEWVQINADTKITSLALGLQSATNASTIALAAADNHGGAFNSSVQVVGGTNVTVATDTTNNTITISSTDTNDDTKYDLVTASHTGGGAEIKLNGNDTTSDTVVLAGSGGVTVSAGENNTITIAGASGIDQVSTDFDGNGVLTTAISFGNGEQPKYDSVTPTITYGTTEVARQTAVFANGTANLAQIYTKTEVDSAINAALGAANAMTYKGAIASISDATTKLVSTANVGDTYKVGVTLTTDNAPVAAKVGDLVIAEGTDGNVSWVVIPSGDDQNISVAVNAASNLFSVQDGPSTSLGSISISAGDDIVVSSSASGNALGVTVAHKPVADMTGTAVAFPDAVSISQEDGSSVSIPIIEAISKDAYGHITSITTGKALIKDTHATLNNIGYTSSGSSSSVAFTGQIGLDGAAVGKTFEQTISSSTLTLAATDPAGDNTAGMSIDLVWGTF